jgi:hypothetical protein
MELRCLALSNVARAKLPRENKRPAYEQMMRDFVNSLKIGK